jgi:hypothetical protein
LAIWTAPSLAREALPFAAPCWRLAKPPSGLGILKLVDTVEEQAVLQRSVQDAALLPPACRHLDNALSASFSRRPAYPAPSRFRRAGFSPGVFYAAERVATAVAETAFYYLLGFVASPATPWPREPAVFQAFSAAVATGRAVDLTAPPLNADAPAWTHPTEYGPCQDFADQCRAADVAVIRYRSVRDPGHGDNVAVLDCAGFAKPAPMDRQNWRIRINAFGIQALCLNPETRIGFDRETFAADPRLAGFRWDRG